MVINNFYPCSSSPPPPPSSLSCEKGYLLYSIQKPKLYTAKWLYLLNGMLYYYNSCHILKPIPQHVMPYFNPQHLAHASATYKTRCTLFFRKPRGKAANSFDFVVLVHQVLLAMISRLSLIQQKKKKSHGVRLRLR